MLSIKQLIAGLVLLVIIGVGAFLYRNTMERPAIKDTATSGACTEEARVCPDGTAVGREGPSCAFAKCAPPNVELEGGISFVTPTGYVRTPATQGAVAQFEKPSLSGTPSHTIRVQRIPVPSGQTVDAVILANTRYQPADMQAENFNRFLNKTIEVKTFRTTVIERFEAQIQSVYYLARSNEVLRFEVTEHDVISWMDPNLIVEELPEHRALLTTLGTLQVTN